MSRTQDILKRANRLTAGLVLLTAGILLLVTRGSIAIPTATILGLFLLATGIYGLINFFVSSERRSSALTRALFSLCMSLLLTVFKDLSFLLLLLLFVGYLVFIALIKGIDAVLAWRNHAGECWLSAFFCLVYLVFAILLFAMPNYQASTLYLIFGIQLVLFGSIFLLDFLTAMIPTKAKNKLKARVRIPLPVMVATFIPYTVQKRVNDYLNAGNERNFESNLELSGDPDLVVYIHVAKQGFNAIGHCDVWFEGEILAYGNYDEPASSKIGTGPGVLLVSNRDEYLPFCLQFNKTTIFAFGLKLTEQQKTAVRSKVQDIKQNTEPWDPPYQAAQKAGDCRTLEEFPDFPSHLVANSDSHLHKFKKGHMKTYFVFTTNCVMLADQLVGKAGAGVLQANGILSPGTLYDYLDTEYYKADSFVVSRDVYRYDDIKSHST